MKLEAIDCAAEHTRSSADAEMVREFVRKHEIISELADAVRLAESHFSCEKQICLRLEADPEAVVDCQYLVIDVLIVEKLDTATMIASYNGFVNEWAATPNALARQLICLTVAT